MPSSPQPSRRAVAVGAAWSVPVIAAGVTAPVLAASSVATASMSKSIPLDVTLVNIGTIGSANVALSGTVPVEAHDGDELSAVMTATIVITEQLLASMRASTGTGEEGNLPTFGPSPAHTAYNNVKYTVAGAVATPGQKTVLITFPYMEIPLPDPTNEVPITVTIVSPAETASGTGSVTALLDEVEVNLSLLRPDGTQAIRRWLKMTPQEGADNALFTATIA